MPYITMLLLVFSVASSFIYSEATYAACPPGQVAGVSGTPQGDPAKCYTPGNNTPVGDNTNTEEDPTAGGGATGDGAEESGDDVTCAIEKIGWILCPVIEQSARIGDQAFAFLAKTFLETEPELISNTQGAGTQMAWDMARNLANIMFIIAFLIIIYSQITGAGITNYGIKKMLPRLILAAIAVNVSYYICQIMVDLSNIMGYELQRFLVDAASRVTQNTAMPIASGDSFQSGGGVLSTIAVSVLAAGLIIYFLLPVLGAVIGLVLITCLSIIIILLLRKAFIVLLIVASPIAFVMYLLPNTEKYFQKWLSMFWKLLLVFPVIGLLMGGGQLASSVVLVAGVSSNTYDDGGNQCVSLPNRSGAPTANSGGECTPGAVPYLLGLTAAGIAVLPLIAVWSVLKGALSAAGAIGGKIGATVSSMNNGRKNALSKARAENSDYRKNRRDALALQGGRVGNAINLASLGGARRGAMRRQKYRIAKEELNRAEVDHVANTMVGSDGELTPSGRIAAGLLSTPDARQRVAANAINAQRKLEQDANTAAQSALGNMEFGGSRANPNWTDGGAAGQRARDIIASGNFDSPHLAAILEHLGKTNQEAFMQLATSISANSGGRASNATRTAARVMSGTGLYGGGDIARMENGVTDMDTRSIAESNVARGAVSPAALAKMTSEGLETLYSISAGNAAARAEVRTAAGRMSADQSNNMGNDKLNILGRF